jgi:hypothetical protein
MTDPISKVRRNTARKVGAAVIARASTGAGRRGVVRRSALQAAIAASVNHTARLPRWRSAASYFGQFVTWYRCFGI